MAPLLEDPVPTTPPPVVIDQKKLAALLSLGEATIERHMASGRIPAPRRLGRRILWCYDEVREWLKRPKADGTLMTQAEWNPIWSQLVRTGRN